MVDTSTKAKEYPRHNVAAYPNSCVDTLALLHHWIGHHFWRTPAQGLCNMTKSQTHSRSCCTGFSNLGGWAPTQEGLVSTEFRDGKTLAGQPPGSCSGLLARHTTTAGRHRASNLPSLLLSPPLCSSPPSNRLQSRGVHYESVHRQSAVQ